LKQNEDNINDQQHNNTSPATQNQNDIKTPKEAYLKNDAAASKQIHEQKIVQDNINDDKTNLIVGINPNTGQKKIKMIDDEIVYQSSPEHHKKLGEFIKSIIYGGLDGIMTTFSIVAAVSGSNSKPEIALVFGLANVFADSISMGMGDYLSEKAEIDFATSERVREEWEFKNYQEGEIGEMIGIYEKKGIERKDAEIMLRTMAKYPKFFIDHMMVQELEIHPPDEDENPMKNGFVTLVSFLVFGCIPLLSYIIFVTFLSQAALFGISCALTIVTLFILGVIKGKLTDSDKLSSGILITANGAFAAALSYAIGLGLSHLTNTRGS